MRSESVVLRSDAAKFVFDGVNTVLASLDVGYPKVICPTCQTMRLNGADALFPSYGEGEVTLDGYILDRGRGTELLRSKLTALTSVPGEYILTVGDRSRRLVTKSLTFSSEAPFASGLAEKFRLIAVGSDPFFRSGEEVFAFTPYTSGGMTFAAKSPFAFASRRSSGEVIIENGGDEWCGIKMEITLGANSNSIIIDSDREDGSLVVSKQIAAGNTVVIDTGSGHKGVTISGGENLLSYLNDDVVFFKAPPGVTRLRVRSFGDVPPTVCARITPGYLRP